MEKEMKKWAENYRATHHPNHLKTIEEVKKITL